MTVSELVEMLKQFDPDSRITIQGIEYETEGLTEPKVRGYPPEGQQEGFVVIE